MRAPAHVIRARRRQQPFLNGGALQRHRDFIAGLRCVGCGKPPPSECAQLCPAMDTEASQQQLLPLCGPETVWHDCCHSRMHFAGPSHFWSGLGIDARDVARQLWILSGDRQAGEWLIRKARRCTSPRPRHLPDPRVNARAREPVQATGAQ